MGRTLHYNVKPLNGRFTRDELVEMRNFVIGYAEQTEWTCEYFDLDPFVYYPNWSNGSNWEKIEAEIKCLATKEVDEIIIIEKLFESGLILFHKTNPELGFYWFCKVGGNEANAKAIVSGFVALSKQMPNVSISVHDEGEYLRCPVIIEHGQAKIDTNDIESSIAYLLSSALFDKLYKDCCIKFVQKAHTLWSLKQQYQSSKCEYNISLFCRAVNGTDFANYPEYNTTQIMAGFEGEYYGLTDKDPEAESLKMCANIKAMIPDNLTMVVAPKFDAHGKVI